MTMTLLPGWIAYVYQIVGNHIIRPLLHISPSTVRDFVDAKSSKQKMSNFADYVRDMLKCDFENVILCTNRSRNIVSSFFLAAMAVWMVTWILPLFGLSSFSLMLFALVPSLAMWHAYSYTPTCLPMVPTCLLPDLVDTLQLLLPDKIQWPTPLLTSPGCLASGGGGECLKSCLAPPFNFNEWQR